MNLTVKQLNKGIEDGPYAWPGGYPVFAFMSDGEAMCFKCLKDEKELLVEALESDGACSGWEVAGFTINYEDAHLYCCNCNDRIESAYAEDEIDILED